MEVSLHEPWRARAVQIPIDNLELAGELVRPTGATGLVIFAHGSGSSRLSPRNVFVARQLQQRTMATLLVDLLSEAEDSNYQSRFDIKLLTERLLAITNWAVHNELTQGLTIGYFGASTGAAAAILAAVGAEQSVKAVVSRGGRVDLAYEAVPALRTPTLLIVGREDPGVLEANEELFLKLQCRKELAIIPKATHLFEEPGTLERVAELAGDWFMEYLRKEE